LGRFENISLHKGGTLINKFDKKNLLWIFLVSTLILALGSLPTWVGQAAQTDKLRFRGIYFDPQDYAVNTAMMQAGRNGDWTYHLRFTSEAHQPVFIKMFYVILGHLSLWTGMGVELTYHLARWLLGYLALFNIYYLSRRFFENQYQARFAFILAATGSGLGWLQLMMGAPLKPISPIDFWLIDTYVFFSLSIFPHFAYQLALMTAALSLYLDYLKSFSRWKILWICLMALAVQIVNPIAFIVLDAAFIGASVVYWWLKRRIEKGQLLALCLVGFVQIPLLIYNYMILFRDPVWSQFTAQNLTLSPPPWFYFWGLALFWIFTITGVFFVYKKPSPAWGALITWELSSFILAYFPVTIQRRFVLGVSIPLGFLAIFGLGEIFTSLSNKQAHPSIGEGKWVRAILQRENLISFAYVLLVSISSIYLSLGSSLHMLSHPPEYFYPADLENALVWLDQTAVPDQFVLSAANTGQLIAQHTDLKVYLGHEMETLNFKDKETNVTAFYQGRASAQWLSGTHVRWIVYGPYEAKLSPSFQPDKSFHLVYKNESVEIYEVQPD
jgi:hypothetical protein